MMRRDRFAAPGPDANRKPQTANRKPQTANRRPKTEDRRPKTETEPELENEIKSILQHRAAGDPMDSSVLWTDLTLVELAKQLFGVSISVSPR